MTPDELKKVTSGFIAWEFKRHTPDEAAARLYRIFRAVHEAGFNEAKEKAAKIMEDYGSQYRFNSDEEAVEFENTTAEARALKSGDGE